MVIQSDVGFAASANNDVSKARLPVKEAVSKSASWTREFEFGSV